jgi:hypothetical protein
MRVREKVAVASQHFGAPSQRFGATDDECCLNLTTCYKYCLYQLLVFRNLHHLFTSKNILVWLVLGQYCDGVVCVLLWRHNISVHSHSVLVQLMMSVV